MPFFSIILTLYNSSEFVKEALESVKYQTFQDFELIISDDTSTDDSVNICETWLGENPSIKARAKILRVSENTGISANMNRAVRASQGEWIKDLSGDDVLAPDCLESGLSFIKEHPNVDIFQAKAKCFEGVLDLSSDSGEILDQKSVMNPSDDFSAQDQYKKLLRYNYVTGPAVFYKRELIQKMGYFDEEIPFIDDWPMWLQITKNGYKIEFLDKIIVYYRKHSSSISQDGQGAFFNAMHRKTRAVFLKYINPNISVFERLINNSTYHFKEFMFKHLNNKNNGLGRFFFRIFNRGQKMKRKVC